MFYKVNKVDILEEYKLKVFFDNDECRIYDMSKLLDLDFFKDLKDIENLFYQVKVDVGGYGIYWNDEIDLSSNDLYINGIEA